MKKKPTKQSEVGLDAVVVPDVGLDFLAIEPDDMDLFRCRTEVQRLQRTINILIAADFCTHEKAEQAYEIAGWK
jgi:hypothetical protein